MKSLLLIMCLSFNVVFASEETVVVKSENEDSILSKIPQNLMATFLDQKFKQTVVSPGVFDLTIKNLRCDYYSRDVLFPDAHNAGLPKVNCYVNAEPLMNGTGKAIEESRFVYHLLEEVEAKTGLVMSDCSMGGKCITFISKIKCLIDLNQIEMHKAYSCAFTKTLN